jgi:hypothetical protein
MCNGRLYSTLDSYLFPTLFLAPMAVSKIGLMVAPFRGMKNRMVHRRLEPNRAEGTIQYKFYLKTKLL